MKLQVPFVQLPVLFDADELAREIGALDVDSWRDHPQKYPGNFALPLISVDGDPDSDAVAGPMRATPYLSQCPYLMQVMSHLGAVWGRARLMKLVGQAEVSPHFDMNYYWRERMRVHVPIVTRPTVRFVCGDAEVNMAAGECWIFDTWRTHRVINGADDERIHLVADTVGSSALWSLIGHGYAPTAANTPPEWRPEWVPRSSQAVTRLRYESINVPDVMTPWELREHLFFLLSEAKPHSQLDQARQHTLQFLVEWQSLWAQYGNDHAGWPAYRHALNVFDQFMQRDAVDLELINGGQFGLVLRGMILGVALADRGKASGNESRPQAAPLAVTR
jgi:Aspartyl/Asparaginyl beta-hydroxylase.